MTYSPDGIAIHHSAGSDTDENNWEGIKRYHSKKWDTDTTGYHWLIERVGMYYDTFNPRDEGQKGIHVKGHNSEYIGFCFVGDYSDKKPNRLKLDVGAREIARSMFRNHISFFNIQAHHEICEPGHTDCPGDEFDMEGLREKIRRHYIDFLAHYSPGGSSVWPIHAQQQTLNMLGFEAGPVDNINGEKTKEGRRKASKKLPGVDTSSDWGLKLQKSILTELTDRFMRGDDSSGYQTELMKVLQDIEKKIKNGLQLLRDYE